MITNIYIYIYTYIHITYHILHVAFIYLSYSSRLTLAGTSAGGHIASLLALKCLGEPRPVGIRSDPSYVDVTTIPPPMISEKYIDYV